MNLQDRIHRNVRDQSTISSQVNVAREEVEKLQVGLSRLAGQMELLQELFKDEHGVELSSYIEDNAEFRDSLIKAKEVGIRIASGESNEGVNPKAQLKVMPKKGVVHTGNKKPPDADKEPDVQRIRNPPKIVIDDDPPKPEDDEKD